MSRGMAVTDTLIGNASFYDLAASFLNQTVINNKYILWPMHPPQLAFLALPTSEALYGGAAGGGKSVALLAGALQYVHVPGYSALLLRRTFADLMLPDSLIPMAHLWLKDTDAVWSGSTKSWLFPSGAKLTFGYLQDENDKYRYQSAAFQYIGFDELTQFSETQYTYLSSRLRKRTDLDVILRQRAATNPGGFGHDWVKQRFVVEENADCPFIPAHLEDNPDLDRLSYEQSLSKLDPVTRAQLRHGDWSIRPEGNMFKREWFAEWLDKEPLDVARWVRHWDLAATEPDPRKGNDPDWVSGCKLGLRRNGTYVIADMRHFRTTPRQVEAMVQQTAAQDGKGVQITIEEEGGASGKLLVDYYQRSALLGYSVQGRRPTGDKVTRAQPLSAAVEQGRVALVRGNWVNTFLDELCAFPAVNHDDQVDATSGAFNELSLQAPAGPLIRTKVDVQRHF